MRDLFMVGVLVLLFLSAFKRPFMMTLGYMYVDLVQPQEVSWYLLNSVPVSLIFGASAVLFYVLFDQNKSARFGPLQALMLAFLGWVTLTTFNAQLPEVAWEKWNPTWKAIGFAIFLPFVLSTRQRLEAALMIFVLSVGSLTITGAIKTLLGGGGYGTLNLLVDRNTGLYEGSTISTVAIAVIPLIIYLYKYNSLVPKNRLTLLCAAGLVFSSVLIPIGTEARTGLVCLAVLGGLMWIGARRKLLYAGAAVVLALAAIPLLPESFTGRMSTIETYDEDASASTRLAVWGWTIDFVKDHPLGGGFGAYRLNRLEVTVRSRTGDESSSSETSRVLKDEARAYHSSYFEMLGEHGYFGLLLFLAMLVVALVQLRRLYTRFRDADEDRWIADVARAIGFMLIIYMVGSIFVGIGTQSPQYFLYAFTAALAQIATKRLPSKQALHAATGPAVAPAQ